MLLDWLFGSKDSEADRADDEVSIFEDDDDDEL